MHDLHDSRNASLKEKNLSRTAKKKCGNSTGFQLNFGQTQFQPHTLGQTLGGMSEALKELQIFQKIANYSREIFKIEANCIAYLLHFNYSNPKKILIFFCPKTCINFAP